MAKASVPPGLIAAALLLLVGCGARHEYRGEHLVLERSGWDTLHVGVSFVRRAVLGGDSPIKPESILLSVFDEGYETVYEGGPGSVPLPDRRLGDRERLTVEVCGIVRGRRICLQDMIRASPKRLSLDGEIIYPTGSDLAEGQYVFIFSAERQIFAADDWESIEPSGVKGFVLAWVESPEGRERGTVRIPFESTRGSFDLSRGANYKNFRYYLDSELLDEEIAGVNFEVHAGLGGDPARLAVVRKEVRHETEDERADAVRYFVEQSTERLIDELGSFLGGRRAVAYVEDWEYDRLSRTYRVTVEARWEGPVFNRRTYEVEGTLEVSDDGSDASFRLRSGNRRAVDRWRDRVDGDILRLGTLDVLGRDQRVSTLGGGSSP